MKELTEPLAANVLATVDAGLVAGLGSPEPGKMCVEAAVCFAYGLSHSDNPPCVGSAVRALKIALNDKFNGSPQERARLMRRLAIAQLGSHKLNQVEFAIRVALLVCREPAFVLWANNWLSGKDRSAVAAEAARVAGLAAWAAARTAKAARAAAWVEAAVAAWVEAAAKVEKAEKAAAWAAKATAAEDLSDFAEQVVQILVDMKSPGTQFLHLTERELT